MSRRFASLCLCFLCCAASAGCELIADFDRGKIPGEATAGQGGSSPPRPDAAMPDGGADEDASSD